MTPKLIRAGVSVNDREDVCKAALEARTWSEFLDNMLKLRGAYGVAVGRMVADSPEFSVGASHRMSWTSARYCIISSPLTLDDGDEP
jgi:hypothetical protein